MADASGAGGPEFSVSSLLPGLLQDSIDLWQENSASTPHCERTFSAAEQDVREKQLERFLLSLHAELRRLPRTRSDRQAARERLTEAFGQFAKAGLDLDDRHLDLLLRGGFSAVGTDLARQARRFDPAVSIADILTASRNAWTACGLQTLLGHSMRLTPAIFAYSMLYPYTDNYLDDPAASREAKLGFSARFGRRLAGDAPDPANDREAAIWKLVELIEGQYTRAAWPQVFDSLLAIHQAQEQSIRLLRRNLSAQGVDILQLVFQKGGASVLADGFLAAGSLTSKQAAFVFAWGVLLQLLDDLQDVQADCKEGVLTLFSHAAGRQPLDDLTSRTLHFAQRVMGRMSDLPAADHPALKELIQQSSWSLLIRSAGEAGQLYTKEYLAELETHSPFRFAFLHERRALLAKQNGGVLRLFEAFLEGEDDEPAFPFLPSSLMPRV